MTAFFRWILSIVVTVVVVLFALANRHAVDVVWSPVHGSVSLPVFLVGLAGLVLGFVTGGLTVWLNGGALRRERRQQRKTIKKLEKELQTVRELNESDESNDNGSVLQQPVRKLLTKQQTGGSHG